MVPDERTEARKKLRARVTVLLDLHKKTGRVQFLADGFLLELWEAEKALTKMNADFRQRDLEARARNTATMA